MQLENHIVWRWKVGNEIESPSGTSRLSTELAIYEDIPGFMHR